jgi:hypothetical protein
VDPSWLGPPIAREVVDAQDPTAPEQFGGWPPKSTPGSVPPAPRLRVRQIIINRLDNPRAKTHSHWPPPTRPTETPPSRLVKRVAGWTPPPTRPTEIPSRLDKRVPPPDLLCDESYTGIGKEFCPTPSPKVEQPSKLMRRCPPGYDNRKNKREPCIQQLSPTVEAPSRLVRRVPPPEKLCDESYTGIGKKFCPTALARREASPVCAPGAMCRPDGIDKRQEPTPTWVPVICADAPHGSRPLWCPIPSAR